MEAEGWSQRHGAWTWERAVFLPSSGGELGSWEAGLRVLHARQRVRGLAPRGRRAVLLAVLLVSRERRKLVLPSPPEPLHPLRDPPSPPSNQGRGVSPGRYHAFQAESPGCRGPCQSRPLALRQGGWPTPKRWGGVGWGVCPGRAREGRGPAPGAFRGGRREGREEGTLARGPGRCRPALGCGRRRKGCEWSGCPRTRRPEGPRAAAGAPLPARGPHLQAQLGRGRWTGAFNLGGHEHGNNFK